MVRKGNLGAAALVLLALAVSGAALAAQNIDRGGKPAGYSPFSELEAAPDSSCYVTRLDETGCDDAACQATVCGIDSWCCNVNWDSICVGEAQSLCAVYDWPEPPESAAGLARILVYKEFDDDNTQEVDVHVSCNSGLPLEQDFQIAEGEIVIFVLDAFEDGVPDCTVTETAPAGYTPRYYDHLDNISDEGCTFEAVADGGSYACYVYNRADPVDVTIEAEWEVNGNDYDISQFADVSLVCDPVPRGPYSFHWTIDGNSTLTASVVPYWDGGTNCNVFYEPFASEVEASGCTSPLHLEVAGDGASCTITFTVFFEGIPAVNAYGLAVLAVLMLGIGLVGFRRFA
jgi:hypothetical protein